jgi:hypothetical protein
VLVVAGDVSELITRSIRLVSALTTGEPAIFLAGNHERLAERETLEEKNDAAQLAARKHGVHFLECNVVDIAGVRFAGATLWTPDDPRFAPSVRSLAAAHADVVITHFEPTPALQCRKHLVPGNHDHDETRALPWFSPPRQIAEVTIEGRRIVLCHYAMRTWSGQACTSTTLVQFMRSEHWYRHPLPSAERLDSQAFRLTKPHSEAPPPAQPSVREEAPPRTQPPVSAPSPH